MRRRNVQRSLAIPCLCIHVYHRVSEQLTYDSIVTGEGSSHEGCNALKLGCVHVYPWLAQQDSHSLPAPMKRRNKRMQAG